MKESLKNLWEKENSTNLIISGRQDPVIYAFSTQTVPNYLKVGDTYRLLSTRLGEWKKYYKNLKIEFSGSALVPSGAYFRDFAVHSYLKNDLKKHQLQKGELSIPYYSREFFKNTSPKDIEAAIEDIKDSYQNNKNKYQYYDTEKRLPKSYKYKRDTKLILRDEQNEVVERFKTALKKNRTNLLLYAVMRFGKSVVALRCAQEMKAKTVLIVSAKADVGEEWKRTVQSITGFEKLAYINAKDLLGNKNKIKNTIKRGETAVIFLTLQDLNGERIKEKHKELFDSKIDLIIVDETHFGAWANSYGEVLKNVKQIKEPKDKREGVSDVKEFEEAREIVKSLRAKIKLHLSGTPYRVLLEKKFTNEDIIGYYRLSDIENAKRKWDEDHFADIENSAINSSTGKPYQEWDNPYFGFPQMIRFAFNPTESARKKLNELRKGNSSTNLSDLFMPKSIKKDNISKLHTKFQYEKEVLDLVKAIDGSKEDKDILGFLDDARIKKGKMCRHMVFVLPYRASCDALETLINTHKKEFLNLYEYKIINISGVDNDKQYKTVESIKKEIQECEENDQKTITLTVNRMLTGVTVEEWDSMVFLKSLSSAQEYDQAIFRIQNQYIRKYPAKSENNDFIKRDMKPQTLLVDFEPSRMFRIQEKKSKIYNWYEEKNGNAKLKERLENDLSISPIIYFNLNKIQRVTAVDLMKYISDYSNDTSVIDELKTLDIDMEIYNVPKLKEIIDSQSLIGGKRGLLLEKKAHEGEETDLNIEASEQEETKKESEPDRNTLLNPEERESLIRLKIEAYYAKILFYAFLTKDSVSSIGDIVGTINKPSNKYLSKNIGIDKATLGLLQKKMNPPSLSQLDYKIQNINELANDKNKTPIERMQNALNKFNRLSDSEIITPNNICGQMIDGLGEDIKKGPILDIASKAGEFALAAYEALKKLGVKEDVAKNCVYSIPTSPIAYEFTRKMYEAIGLNTDNIAKKFTAYDIIKETPKNSKKILCQSRKFYKIKFDINNIKAGGKQVKFHSVVGNPPYNTSTRGQKTHIWHHFVNLANKLGASQVSMIHPSGWIKGGIRLNATRSNWQKRKNLKEVELMEYEVFPGIGIGQVTITHFDNTGKKFENTTLKVYSSPAELKLVDTIDWASNTFYESAESKKINSIVKKFRPKEKNESMTSMVAPQRNLGISGRAFKNKDHHIFTKEPSKECQTKVLVNEKLLDDAKKRLYYYIDKRDDYWHIRKRDVNKYKVAFSATGNKQGKNNYLLLPGELATDKYLMVLFDTKKEAENFQKYLSTKFYAFSMKPLLVDQNALRKTHRNAPKLDFSTNKDINWDKSVLEINQQLYKKYSITKKDQAIIEEAIQ